MHRKNHYLVQGCNWHCCKLYFKKVPVEKQTSSRALMSHPAVTSRRTASTCPPTAA